jgi:hypothetical protein
VAGGKMLAVIYVNLNWVLIILSIISAALSVQEYSKKKSSIAILSALAWVCVALISGFSLWAQ